MMSYCTRCGAYVPSDEKRCPACGAAQSMADGGAATQSAPEPEHQQQYTDTSREPWEQKRTQREPWEKPVKSWEPWKNAGSDSRESTYAREGKSGTAAVDERKLSVLSYIGPLFVLPLLLRKGDAFARHHANQGLLLFLLEIAIGSLLGDSLLAVAGSLFCVYCIVLGARSVALGRMDKLPFIGNIRLIK